MTVHESVEAKQPKGPSNRKFGFFFGGVFTLIGLYYFVRHGIWLPWSFVLAAVMIVLAVLVPSVLTWPNRAWMKLGLILGQVVTPIVMGVLFLVVVTPWSLVWRLLGGGDFKVGFDRKKTTYWKDRRVSSEEFARRAHQQF